MVMDMRYIFTSISSLTPLRFIKNGKRYIVYVIAIASFFVTPVIWAVEKTEKLAGTVTVDPVTTNNLLQVTLGLFAVLVLIFGIAWFVKRYSGFSGGSSQSLQIIGSLSMGQRERVVLMRVGDTQLLIGVAPGRVQKLHVLETPIPLPDTSKSSVDSFAEKLQPALRQRIKS